MADFGFDDLLSIPTAGGYTAVKQATGFEGVGPTFGETADWIGDTVSSGAEDFINGGTNRSNIPIMGVNQQYWGGNPMSPREHYNEGSRLGGAAAGQAHEGWDYMMANGPGQGQENQELSDLEFGTRQYDQAGAMQLQREAAMGQAPSEAAYMMQRGLDQGLASQQAQMGGARGAAGLALAGGNAMANSANMQNQAFTNAGQLRAGEMAQARGAYGDMANQMRAQDQSRLGQGNAMSQFNAGQRGQFGASAGNVGAAYGNVGLGYYADKGKPFSDSLSSHTQTAMGDPASRYRGFEGNADIAGRNATSRQAQGNKAIDTLLSFGQTAGSAAASGGGGSKSSGGGIGGTKPSSPYDPGY